MSAREFLIKKALLMDMDPTLAAETNKPEHLKHVTSLYAALAKKYYGRKMNKLNERESDAVIASAYAHPKWIARENEIRKSLGLPAVG